MKKGVNIVITNNKGKVLILKRSLAEKYCPNFWDLPGGKVENGETLQEAAVRETKEECGLNMKIGKNYFYVYCCKDKQLNIYGFKTKLVDGNVLLSEEHTDFRWVNKEIILSGDYPDWIKKEFNAII